MKPTSEGSIKITENEADKTALLLKAGKENVDDKNTVIIGEKEGGREGGRDPIFLVHDFLPSVQDRLKAVPVDTFGEHVQRMHADRDKMFEQEYNVSFHTALCSGYILYNA